MQRVATTFTLGLSALLTDPADERPGGFYRDELLFHVRDQGHALASYYELREVLSADLPMASGSDDDRGELVVIAGDRIGGPLSPATAAHLLRAWQRTPQRATVAASAEALGLTPRAIVVPDVYRDAEFPTTRSHPFAGLRVRSARLVRDAVRAIGGDEVDAAIAMLTFCAVHSFVVAVCEA